MPRNLTVIREVYSQVTERDHDQVIDFPEFKRWIKSPRLFQNLFAYGTVRLVNGRIETIARPFIVALALRFVCRGVAWFEDQNGHTLPITIALLVKLAAGLVKDYVDKPILLGRLNSTIKKFYKMIEVGSIHPSVKPGIPVYLRTDLIFGLKAGGSVGHIAGVLNNLNHFTGKPVFLSTDPIPTVAEDIETYIIYPEARFWNFVGLPTLFFNQTFIKAAISKLSGRPVSFIYQRYSAYNFAGLELSSHFGVPLIIEYNGSEIWINRHWGDSPLPYEELASQIEDANLKIADLIVVVSQPMKDELVGRGISADKILVNPNGVNPGVYSPDVDGSEIRRQYSLEEKIVLGFIGTFGRWHGAEILADAFGKLIAQYPEYRNRVRLMMIGDGLTLPEVRQKIDSLGISDLCILTGTVPQTQGPAHLAACDILVSPHVPNADGTPFFGSPTKLFEYMAMGRGIVASDLEQIGEVLEHGKTAWMVEPGNVDSLVEGLNILIGDPILRERLGLAARHEAVVRYTWKEHTRKIIEALIASNGTYANR